MRGMGEEDCEKGKERGKIFSLAGSILCFKDCVAGRSVFDFPFRAEDSHIDFAASVRDLPAKAGGGAGDGPGGSGNPFACRGPAGCGYGAAQYL